MSDRPTPAEIEAGAEAFVRAFPFAEGDTWPEIVRRHPAFVDAARRAVRAVLPGHDARLRAQVAEEIARAIEARARTSYQTRGPAYRDAAAIARVYATGGDHERDD